jgi:hypothetical protein
VTFNERVKARWQTSIAMFLIGFAVAEALVWVMMSFIVFVAIPIEAVDHRRLLLTVVQILIGAVYLWSWAVRGIQLVNIDTILQDAGDIERKLIAARIAQEGVEVKELVGGSGAGQP